MGKKSSRAKKSKSPPSDEKPTEDEANPIDLWTEIVNKFVQGLEKSLEILKERSVDNIPGAKEQLIRRFEELLRYIPRNNGQLLIKMIDESIAQAFFPFSSDLSEAFAKILKSRTHEQDFIINELINGFIASQSKSFGNFKEGPIIDRMVEAFKKSRSFRISDYQFFAMFGDPNKPRNHIVEELKKIVEFLGLVEEQVTYSKDRRRSEEKTISYYTFPPEILNLIEGLYIITNEKGERVINEEFDKNVFICTFLARFAIDRYSLDSYKVNGICAIFALILILSMMPKVKLAEDNPILKDPSFDPNMMSVIPKSWMMKEVLVELLPPAIETVALRLGASKWHGKIETSDAQKRLHLQTRFLIKDINKWVLGNLCRVEIPIFVEISNIFQEVLVGTDAASKDD